MNDKLTQPQVDAVTKRIKSLVQLYGGSSPQVRAVKVWYTEFFSNPNSDVYASLVGAVRRAEATVLKG